MQLKRGPSQHPAPYYTLDLVTLRKLHVGEMNALTAMGKSVGSDSSPMEIGFQAGFKPDKDFFSIFLPQSFHFWTRGLPEIIPYGAGLTRQLHGAGSVIFFYKEGFKSAWARLEKGMHANKEPHLQVGSSTTLVIVLKGIAEARIGGKRAAVSAGSAILVPAGVAHEFWNERDEPAELVLIMTD